MSSPPVADLRARANRQETVADLSQLALNARDLEPCLEAAVESVAETIDAEYVAAFEHQPEQSSAVLASGEGWAVDREGSASLSTASEAFLDRVLAAEEPVVVEHPEAAAFDDEALLASHDVASGVAVAIGPAAEPWGVLAVFDVEPTPYAEDDVEFVADVADVLGSAVEDLAEREAREQELEARERELEARERELHRFQTLFAESEDVNAVLAPDGTCTYVPPSAEHVLGYEPEALIGEDTFQFVHPEDRERVRETFARLVEEPDLEPTLEFRYRHGDGSWVVLETTGRNLLDDPYIEGIVAYTRDVTERHEHERELEAQIAAMEESVDGIAILDDEEEYVFVNQAHAEIYGYDDPDAFLGNTWRLCYEDDEAERIEAEALPEMREAGSWRGEATGRCADGSTFPQEVSLTALDDGRLVCLVRDVSERKERERELAERERQLSTLMDNVPGMVYRCENDRGWPMEFVSDACERITRYEPEAIESGEVSFGEDVVLDADQDELWENIQVEVTNREPFAETYRVETADGEVRWVRDHGRGVFEDGELVALEGIITDVTERKRLESEFEEVYGRVTDAFYALDDQWRFTHVNDRAEELIDYRGEGLEGERLWEVFEYAADSQLREEYERAMETQEPTSLEFYYPEPLDIWFEVNAYPSETGLSVYFQDVTERKQRERELEESERRYRTLVDHFPNGAVALVDDDLRYQTVGGSPELTANLSAKQVEGEPVAEALPEDLADDLLPCYEAAVERGERCRFERSVNDRTFQFQVVPVRDDDGEVFAALGMSQDVTERSEYEQMLEESEQRHRTLAEYFPNGVVTLFDHDLEYTLVAGQALEDLPVDPDEATDKHFAEVWGEEIAETLRPAFEAALDGEEYSMELEYEDRDWVFHAVPITDDRGDVFAGMTMAQDITERKEYERYLQDAKSQLEAATEAGAVGTWEWDVQDDEMVASETFARTFGVDPELARAGTSLDRFVGSIHEADRDRVAAEIEAAVEGCSEYDTEYRVRDADGDVRWVSARGEVECDEDGEAVSFPGAITDITERKRAEMELQRSNEQLETLFDVLPVGVVVAEPDGEMVTANDTAEEIWGGDVFDAGTVEEYEQYPVYDAETGERVPPDEMTLARVLDGETVTDPDVYEIDAVDGQRRVIEVQGRPIRDEDGEIVRGVATLEDVTEQHEYQRRIEESERRYRTMIDSFPNGAVGLFDEGLTYQAVGGSVLEDIDVDPEDVVGMDIRERYPEDVADLIAPKCRGALEGETASFELSFHDREWLAHAVPVGDEADGHVENDVEDGGVNAGMLMVQEITERKQMERDLRKSEAKFRLLAENLEQVIWMTDAETGDVQYVNPAFEDVWDCSRDVFYDDPEAVVQAVHPDDRDRVRAAFDDRETHEYDLEYRIVRPDGDVRWLHARTVAIHDGAGEPDRIVGIADDVTERKERERRLREREQRLERYKEYTDDVLDAIDDVFYILDEDGSVLRWNQSLRDVTGYEHEEIADMGGPEFFEGDDRERIAAAIGEGFETGSTQVEAPFCTPDGEEIPYEFAASTLEDPEGNRVLAGIGRDITERRERRRQLEESERRYRTLAEHFPNGAVGVYDGDLRYTLAEGQLLGKHLPPSDELEGQRMPDAFTEDTVADLEPVFRTALEDGETANTETTFGGRHWKVWATPLRDADGEVFAGLSFVQDVTEQVERERELERTLDLLNKTERIADVAGWEVDTETMEPYWSDHLFDLVRGSYDGQPSIEEALDVYATEEDRETVTNAIEAAIETAEPFDFEARFPRPEGDVGWLRVQGEPEVEDGEVVTLRGAVQDVTERTKREERLAELVDRLEESNQRLEQFAYAASHDLQEPLRMVSSYLTLIERRYADELDEDGREFLDYAVDGADRMRNMIEGLLEYSRVETRGDPFEPVDLEEVFEDARKDLQVRIAESNADLEVGDLPTVEGDASQLRQVFQNLLQNAIEYSGDEPPQIEVIAEPRGDEWVLSVHDEGIGLDPDQTERIFQVFQRLHSHEEHPGTGIGLALCRRIVERHGGEIWVDAEPGEGSTFSFTLPQRGTDDG